MLRAFNENIFYRLFLFSIIAFCLTKLWHTEDDRPKPSGIWAAMIVAQLVNIAFNVGVATPSANLAAMLYDAIRYIVPGMCSAWLYWRYSFLTAEIASVCCHIFLRPALGHLLAR